MPIPTIIISWDEASNPPPFYKVIRYLKNTPTTIVDIKTIPSGELNYEVIDNTITIPEFYNNIWVYKIISLCDDIVQRPFISKEHIKITCDLVFTAAPTNNSLPYSFYHLGGDIDRYVIKLYNGATQIGATITKNKPFTSPITGTFTGLTPATPYDIIITPTVTGTSYSKDCIHSVETEEDADSYSIAHTNNTPVPVVQLTIGNNSSTPSTYIYNGAYGSSTIIGTSPANLPATDANVMLYVTGAAKVLSMNCNGVPATVTDGERATWNNIDGALVLSFVTAAPSFLSWDYTEEGSANGSFDIIINGVTVLHRTTTGTGSIPVAYGDIVNTITYGGTGHAVMSVDSEVSGNLYYFDGSLSVDPSHTFTIDTQNYSISSSISPS